MTDDLSERTIRVALGDREFFATARQDDETGQWQATISENGWEWETGDMGPEFFATADEALEWARRMIAEQVEDDTSRDAFEASLAAYTAPELADMLNLSEDRIRRLAVALGVGRKHGRDWLFSAADVDVLRARNTQRGRPQAQQ